MPVALHHLSGLSVTIFSKVWKITVDVQKATVAMKLASVNNTGGNMMSDCLSQGAQGVSMPTPKVNTPAPIVAIAPIKSNVLMEFFSAMIWAEIMLTRQYRST